jgi:hypothetical protein
VSFETPEYTANADGLTTSELFGKAERARHETPVVVVQPRIASRFPRNSFCCSPRKRYTLFVRIMNEMIDALGGRRDLCYPQDHARRRLDRFSRP